MQHSHLLARARIARQITDKITEAEVQFSRMCGYSWIDAILVGGAEGSIAYRMLMGPDPVVPTPRLTMNGRPVTILEPYEGHGPDDPPGWYYRFDGEAGTHFISASALPIRFTGEL